MFIKYQNTIHNLEGFTTISIDRGINNMYQVIVCFPDHKEIIAEFLSKALAEDAIYRVAQSLEIEHKGREIFIDITPEKPSSNCRIKASNSNIFKVIEQ